MVLPLQCLGPACPTAAPAAAVPQHHLPHPPQTGRPLAINSNAIARVATATGRMSPLQVGRGFQWFGARVPVVWGAVPCLAGVLCTAAAVGRSCMFAGRRCSVYLLAHGPAMHPQGDAPASASRRQRSAVVVWATGKDSADDTVGTWGGHRGEGI